MFYFQLLRCCSWDTKWDSTGSFLLSRWLHWVQVTSTRAVWRKAIVEAATSRINQSRGLTGVGEVIMETSPSTTLFSHGTTWSPITGCHHLPLHICSGHHLPLRICSGHPLEENGVLMYLLTDTIGKATTVITTITTRLHWRFSWLAVTCKVHHTVDEIYSF